MPLDDVIQDFYMRDRTRVFRDRREAGGALAESLSSYASTDAIVMAIPSGGVPVAAEVCRLLQLKLEAVVVRKIQFPQDPEAGFGAVGPEGTIVLNDYLMQSSRMSHVVTEEQIAKAKRGVEFREQLFRGGEPYPDMKGKAVILIDDGLASGFTMLAAIGFVKSKGARKVVVAVPTGSERAVELVLEKADEVHCLNIRSAPFFAVADAYKYWYDVSEEEALAILRASV
ncbi:MAG TPA: phosphoribosyltransferase family protein [Methanomassiliicoccales archaeon]|nr:phosphoribosyltransferase family protein [Methanomassiliicoccales archaeon]